MWCSAMQWSSEDTAQILAGPDFDQQHTALHTAHCTTHCTLHWLTRYIWLSENLKDIVLLFVKI
jgi:hypothetical protein